MPPSLAKGLAEDVKDAIADEHAALRGIDNVRAFEKDLSKSHGKLEFVANGSLAHDDLDAYADAQGRRGCGERDEDAGRGRPRRSRRPRS
jgi:hypothetical protein